MFGGRINLAGFWLNGSEVPGGRSSQEELFGRPVLASTCMGSFACVRLAPHSAQDESGTGRRRRFLVLLVPQWTSRFLAALRMTIAI
jgi:hypothetical protein